MRAATGLPAGTARATLIKAYMDHLCTVRDATGQPGAKVELTKEDFLARGKGPDGKGDIQGCSEFNPLMLFSTSEKATLDQPANHPRRNQENQVNRRVMVLLFRPGSLVDPNKWPCPTVEEGVGKCLKRFHSDGQARRSNKAARREFKDTKDTFACRFYDRLTNSSPCEAPPPPPLAPTIDFVKTTLLRGSESARRSIYASITCHQEPRPRCESTSVVSRTRPITREPPTSMRASHW
jgi:hypothetical protein